MALGPIQSKHLDSFANSGDGIEHEKIDDGKNRAFLTTVSERKRRQICVQKNQFDAGRSKQVRIVKVSPAGKVYITRDSFARADFYNPVWAGQIVFWIMFRSANHRSNDAERASHA